MDMKRSIVASVIFFVLLNSFDSLAGTRPSPAPKVKPPLPSEWKKAPSCKIGGKTLKWLFAENPELSPELAKELREQFGWPDLWIQSGLGEPQFAARSNFGMGVLNGVPKSACKDFAAFELPDQLVALGFMDGQHIVQTFLMVVFYDLKKDRPVAAKPMAGAFSGEPANSFESTPDGIRYQTWNVRTDAAGGYGGKIRGLEVFAEEGDLHYWKKAFLKGGKIIEEVDLQTTFERSEYRGFFRDAEHFAKAFALRPDRSDFKNRDVVVKATLLGGAKVTCIQPTEDRIAKTGDENWFCDDWKASKNSKTK